MLLCHTNLHGLKNTHSLVYFHSSGLYLNEEVIGVQQSREQKHLSTSVPWAIHFICHDTHTHTLKRNSRRLAIMHRLHTYAVESTRTEQQ